jgi:hypothetical protein
MALRAAGGVGSAINENHILAGFFGGIWCWEMELQQIPSGMTERKVMARTEADSLRE